ncbi:hypothetical protein PG996_015158 [Apiospora saccharicola]|uniref:Uncharacterized protein n=1 Tax=Apiospora saccharicola TaxID=335842 RepID=A0ABR1TKD8_9PEZI
MLGRMGRTNVESLAFTWQSNQNVAYILQRFPEKQLVGVLETPPILHVAECVRLLGECTRLRRVKITLEKCLTRNLSPEAFRADPGIIGLCSLRSFKEVTIHKGTPGSVEGSCENVDWLVRTMLNRPIDRPEVQRI